MLDCAWRDDGADPDQEEISSRIDGALLHVFEARRSVFVLYEINGPRSQDMTNHLEIPSNSVTIKLPRFLPENALSEFDGGPENPFAKAGVNIGEISTDIKLTRIMVIEATTEKREQIGTGVKLLCGRLGSEWGSLLTVPEKGIGIYARSDENLARLAMLMSNGAKELSFGSLTVYQLGGASNFMRSPVDG